MWRKNQKLEQEELRRLFENGKMKPLTRFLAREIVKTNIVTDKQFDHIALIRAQGRRRTLREVMALGKKARSFLKR